MILFPDGRRKAGAAVCALIFGLALGAVFQVSAQAQDPAPQAGRYIVRSWGLGEGLPQNTVTAIVRTREGYVWLGTHLGLVRFDGTGLRVYNRWNTPGIENDRITALHEDGAGNLWAGTYGGGLSRMSGGEWEPFTAADGLSSDYVTSLHSDRLGALWVGTEDGLNRLTEGGISSFTTWHGLGGNWITSLAEDGGGLLIGALDGGVSVLENLESDDFRPYAEDMPRVVNALAFDGGGRLYIGALNGFYVRDADGLRHYSREDGLSSNSVEVLTAGANGDIFIGLAAGGLEMFRGGEFISLVEAAGFPNDPVQAVLVDRDGNIWAGTHTNGLLQLSVPMVDVITGRDGLTDDEILVVFEDGGGVLWVGTEGGLCRVRDGKVLGVLDATSGLPDSRIRCVLEDAGGTIWVGTDGGLARLDGESAATFTTRDGLSNNEVTALLEDCSGTLWIGTAAGLNRLKDGMIRAYDRTTALGSSYIRVLHESSRNVLHVGTREGLIKFYDRTPLPLYLNEEGVEPDVLSIHEDSGGVLWFGTAGNGLIRYEENEVAVYTTQEGLFDNHIFSITEDARGDLWLSSYVGVFTVARDQLDALGAGDMSRLTPALYDEAEGFRNRQCTFEGEPSACLGRNGLLYCATIEGVAVLDPSKLAAAGAAPKTIIEGMLADNIPVEGPDPHLSEKPHVVQLRFTALDFNAPRKVRFEYRLEGFDEDWRRLGPAGPRTEYYFNLDEGKYLFRVRAAGNRGVWDEAGASLGFSIKRPFYKRPKIYAEVIGVIVAAGAAYAALRRKKRIKPEKYSTSALPDEKIAEVLPRLERLMEEEKVYLDAELSLQHLAKKVGIHYNYLSRIINEKFGLSYNDYVNGYRIEEAKRMLEDPEHAEKTILDIAYDTGFYSKSVFNTAFKKLTGMTPSRYRKQRKRESA